MRRVIVSLREPRSDMISPERPPNPPAPVDYAITSQSYIGRPRPATTEQDSWLRGST